MHVRLQCSRLVFLMHELHDPTNPWGKQGSTVQPRLAEQPCASAAYWQFPLHNQLTRLRRLVVTALLQALPLLWPSLPLPAMCLRSSCRGAPGPTMITCMSIPVTESLYFVLQVHRSSPGRLVLGMLLQLDVLVLPSQGCTRHHGVDECPSAPSG